VFLGADIGSRRVLRWFAKRITPCRTWQRLRPDEPDLFNVTPGRSTFKMRSLEIGPANRSGRGRWCVVPWAERYNQQVAPWDAM
jgi:hypothetical protein